MNSFSKVFSFALILSILAMLMPSLHAQSSVVKTYNFKVFLEDEEIGRQQFVVSSDDSETTVEIEAQFDVKYWFLTAYSYRHTNKEVWDGECLQMIRSQTNDNGKSFFVRGTFVNNQMKLTTHDGIRTIDGCIKTFTYWDRDFLSSQSLLNSQTGEVNKVIVKKLGEEDILVRGQPTPSIHYQIQTEKFSIDLWYASNGEWVSLQSTTENDSKLFYVLQ